MAESRLKKFLDDESAFFNKNKLKTAVSLVAAASMALISARADTIVNSGYNYTLKRFSVTHSSHSSHNSHSTHSTHSSHSTHSNHSTHSTHSSHSSHINCGILG